MKRGYKRFDIHERAWIELHEDGDKWRARLFLDLDDDAPPTFLGNLRVDQGDAMAEEGAEEWAKVFRLVVAEAKPEHDAQIEAEEARFHKITDEMGRILAEMKREREAACES